ncbi:5'-nucleotidase, lipoprotein e(P4) family [Bacillus thuringiensis]|uniref:5'-nucleotidase, lipoprotein e(P4) family n=1 Tax=Bacillus thuringiensis TaxID=1428 RepID=UPI000E4CCD31|nr:5'-nucleotidase, lipoprotein e(P4) family [Bacillus thuringiensis]MDZ3952325.1 5'-nucleotidase, lipoprotein e(P4) family [Bacillus thuringiensis]RGP43734.1 5'-nucleotidase, lipoprotein e(P4) family [Bacillus thuringiensis]
MRKSRRENLVTAILSISLIGCQVSHVQQPTINPLTEQQVMANVWYQTSGEAKALYHQGYNIGKGKLENALAKGTEKIPAIILDLDETVIGNSLYQAMTIKEGKSAPYKIKDWYKQAKAEALPGAVPFLQYANDKGVSIYYISNRKQNQLESTLQNLRQLGIPQADKEHVLLRRDKNEKGKEERRKQVATQYSIILFFGDHLSDFTGFDEKSVEERNQIVEEKHEDFGERFIIFPNPMYGDWESALYQYNTKKSDAEKNKIRHDALRMFEIKK